MNRGKSVSTLCSLAQNRFCGRGWLRPCRATRCRRICSGSSGLHHDGTTVQACQPRAEPRYSTVPSGFSRYLVNSCTRGWCFAVRRRVTSMSCLLLNINRYLTALKTAVLKRNSLGETAKRIPHCTPLYFSYAESDHMHACNY